MVMAALAAEGETIINKVVTSTAVTRISTSG